MARRPGSLKLVEVFGIRVGVDASWFVVLFLVIFALSAQFRDTLDASDGVAYITAVASALLFFASIIVHELGHALAARREGIETSSIHLWFFGGLARLSRDARTPGEEFRMAAAGPFATVVVIVVCVGLGVAAAGWDTYAKAAGLSGSGRVTAPLLLVTWLATINVALLVFNLVPAYPLDGGRIARALVWRLTGDRARGTRAAARLGQVFAYVLAGLGIVLLVEGAVSGVYLLVLGFLFGSSARGAILQSAFVERIEGVRVADIMDAAPVGVPSELPLERARDEYFARFGDRWLPVVDAAGRVVGLLDAERARAGGVEPAASAMEAGDGRLIDEGRSLEDLVSSEPLRRHGALVAVDGEGRLRGVVTVEQVRRALAGALAPPAV
jgi:Zn-dependent protease